MDSMIPLYHIYADYSIYCNTRGNRISDKYWRMVWYKLQRRIYQKSRANWENQNQKRKGGTNEQYYEKQKYEIRLHFATMII